MSEPVLAIWRSLATNSLTVPIIPDGCRDLIFKTSAGNRPSCFLSDLDDAMYLVPMKRGDCYQGFRLLPGVRIDEAKLLASLEGEELSPQQICDRLQVFTHRCRSVAEALDCLAFEASTIAQAASMLGVGQRSLQRLLTRETGRSPVFWLQLARVRKAARALRAGTSFADFSLSMGYADQAHMCRDFRRWLGITPMRLTASTSHKEQLAHAGYASPIGVQIDTRKPFSSLT